MINFVTRNVDGNLRCWLFDSIEEILKEYWVNDGMNLPSNDDVVINGNFIVENDVVLASTFEDIIKELSVVYWKKVRV